MARETSAAFLLTAIALAAATGAGAQTMNANSANFNGGYGGANLNAGYGRGAGDENQPVAAQLTNAQANIEAINGLGQGGAGSSAFNGGGAIDGASGAGGVGSSLDNLTVVTADGSNIVIVGPSGTDDGSATRTRNGKP